MTDARSPRPDLEALMAQRDSLRHLARGLVLDEHRAEDVVHDAWVAALEKPPEPRAPLRAWLSSVVRNVASNVVRREAQRPAREANAARPELVEPGEDRDLELQEEVVASLRRLRQPYRTALYLRYFKDLPPRDIARQQGLPLATVKTHLRRGLALLREELDEENGGDRSAWSLGLLGIAGPTIDPTAVAWDLLRTASSSDVALALATTPAIGWVGGLVLALGATLGWPLLGEAPGDGPGDAIVTNEPVPPVEPVLDDASDLASQTPSEGPRRVALGPAAPQPAAIVAPGITGRVVDQQGLPIAGAYVSTGTAFEAADVILQAGATFALAGTQTFTAETDITRKQVFVTQTDSEGLFEFPPSARHAARLLVQAPGYAELARDLPLESGRTLDAGSLELRAGGILEGRVVDESGRALAGATVSMGLDDELFIAVESDRPRGPSTFETDAEGRFRIDTLAPGRWSVVVSAPGHVARTFEGKALSDERVEQVFELQAGAELEGQARGPIPAGAWVRIAQVDREGGLFGAAQRAALEPDGRFVARSAAAGSLQTLRLVDELGRALGPPVEVRAPARGIELLSDASASLDLAVRDAETGELLEAAAATWVEGGARSWTREVAAGALHWEALRPELEGRLVVRAPGYATANRPLSLAAGEARSIAVDLRSIPELLVTVIDPWGRPLEGAEICLEGEQGVAPLTQVSLLWLDVLAGSMGDPRTDEQGRARVSIDDELEEPRLRIEAPGYLSQTQLLTTAQLDAGELEVHLQPAGSVQLEVRDADDRPIAGALVALEKESSEQGAVTRLGVRRVRTDAAGRATVRDVQPGVYRLRAGRAGDAHPVEVLSGEIAQVVLLGQRTAEVTGTVGVAGTPLVGAEVRFTPVAEPDTFVVVGSFPKRGPATDELGRFQVSGLEPGDYTVEVAHPDRAMPARFERTLAPGATVLDLALDLGTVAGRVVDEKGRPLAGALVSASYAEEDTRIAHVVLRSKRSLALGGAVVRTDVGTPGCRTDSEGRFELVGVATDAPIEIVAEAEGRAPQTTAAFELERFGARRDLELVLTPGGSVAVRVTDAGLPAPGAIVLAQPGVGVPDQMRSATTDRDGVAVFEDLAPGRWTLRGLSTLGLGPTVDTALDEGAEIEVRAGRDERVELRR